MGETEKRRLVPIELAYYCMLAGLPRESIVEGWYDTGTKAVELVHVGFIDRTVVDASFRIPPKESA